MVDRSVFCHLSLRPAPPTSPYHIISAVTALYVAAQLEVVCAIFCVLRGELLSIDRLVVSPFFASPAAAGWLPLLYRC